MPVITTVLAEGVLAARPAASSSNAGYMYFATDVNGGTLYQSTGSSWVQIATGITQAPTAHEASHLLAGSDPISGMDQTQIAVDATEAATNDSLVAGSLRTNMRRIRYQLAQLGTGAWNTLVAMVQLSPGSQQSGSINVSGEVQGSDFKPGGVTGATAASRYVGATASGAPVSGTFVVGDYVIDRTGTIYVCTVAGSPGTWVQLKANPTFSTEVTATDFKPTGLTGATAASRYVGATTSGAPVSGTFAVGDYIVDRTGTFWICTVAGTPGTWTMITGGGGGSSTLAGDTDVSISSPVGGQVLGYSSALSKWVNQNTAGVGATTSTSQLGADVPMASANTLYDGPSVTLSPGTWFLSADVNVTTPSGGDMTVQLWDGTTTVDSGALTVGGSWWANFALSGVVTPTITTTYKVSCRFTSGGAAIKATAINAPTNSSTRLTAIQLSGNPVGQQAPAVRAFNSANISAANGSNTTLTWNTNSFDQGTSTPQHSTSTNTSRLTCQQAGIYEVTANVSFAPNATGERYADILLNGTTVIAAANVLTPGSSSDNAFVTVTALYYLTVGDYIETRVNQFSGGALNVAAGSSFMMARIDSGPGAVQPNTKVQLDYALASDISALSATANTWTDFISNQTFVVDDANSVVEIDVSGLVFTNTNGTIETGARLVIDSAGTAINKMLSGAYWAPVTGAFINVLAGAGTVVLTGLSAGTHTVKLQIQPTVTSSWFCRPVASPAQESLQIRVLERKQSSSPPSSTPAPAVRAYSTATQSIPNNTDTVITLNSTRYDQGTSVPQHSTSVNTARLTCQQAGIYAIGGGIFLPAAATNERTLYIFLNGTTEIGRVTFPASSVADALMQVTCQYQLAVGDYVDLRVWQNSGGSLTSTILANSAPELWMARIDSGGQGFVPIPMVKTANYAILNSDAMVVAGASSLTFTLPLASTRAPGMPLLIKNDNVTGTSIARSGSDTIDGATSFSLSGAYSAIQLVGDGISAWRVF